MTTKILVDSTEALHRVIELDLPALHIAAYDMPSAPKQPRWWRDGTVYQIWPSSFKDSTGTGAGDIPGIISKLDHLSFLGVDVIWLSPMYDTRNDDYGYDIRDYHAIYPPFGTMADMDELIKQVHARGMKLLLDLVINHTSIEHKWFVESKSSKDNPKADWYFWKDPKYDADGKRHPPNNWAALFGGSAWEYVPERDQYFLHLFLSSMPDLNWENEVVRKAIYDEAITFWLKKGIDGFRVDTVNLYSKRVDFPDLPITDPDSEFQPCGEISANGPRIHEFLREQRQVALDPFGDVVLVGELGFSDEDEALQYIGYDPASGRRELDMVFFFEMVMLGGGIFVQPHLQKAFKLTELKAAVDKNQQLLMEKSVETWVTVFSENHDQPRTIGRFTTDDPKHWDHAAKMFALLLSTQSGTLFLYQGQEIGMKNMPPSWGPEEYRDPFLHHAWEKAQKSLAGQPEMLEQSRMKLNKFNRDCARLPVQWSDEENAGFSSVKPWIRVHDEYKTINVKQQMGDPDSVLNFWKKALAMRKEHGATLVHGEFSIVDFENEKVFAFVKDDGHSKILVVLSFTDEEVEWLIPEGLNNLALILGVAKAADAVPKGGKIKLEPWDGRVYEIKS